MNEPEPKTAQEPGKIATVYVVLGPHGQYAHSADIDEALRMASRMIAMDPKRHDELRAKLMAYENAMWGYGFESVWVVPQTWVLHLGKWYVACAFPEKEIDMINRYINDNRDSEASVLCVMDGIAYIASAHDMGAKSLTKAL